MYATETEMEHLSKPKIKDPFDISAQSLFVLVTKLKKVFRAANFRVDAAIQLPEPMHGIVGIHWSGARGDFMLEFGGLCPRTIDLANLAGDKPWMMEVVAIFSEEIYSSALKAKVDMASSMSSSSGLGATALQSILERV